jgi:hypothetical protein
MWTVKTAVDPDSGVIGLNGWFYLLEDDGTPMEFPNEEIARLFIEENGGDPDDEYLEYEDIDLLGDEEDVRVSL